MGEHCHLIEGARRAGRSCDFFFSLSLFLHNFRSSYLFPYRFVPATHLDLRHSTFLRAFHCIKPQHSFSPFIYYIQQPTQHNILSISTELIFRWPSWLITASHRIAYVEEDGPSRVELSHPQTHPPSQLYTHTTRMNMLVTRMNPVPCVIFPHTRPRSPCKCQVPCARVTLPPHNTCAAGCVTLHPWHRIRAVPGGCMTARGTSYIEYTPQMVGAIDVGFLASRFHVVTNGQLALLPTTRLSILFIRSYCTMDSRQGFFTGFTNLPLCTRSSLYMSYRTERGAWYNKA